jgi:hypothetical protein
VLATIALEAPAWLSATVAEGGVVELQWATSASAASREVGYAVLRRQTGASSFLEIARTGAVTFSDAPPPASYDYAVRTVISTFSSAESPLARADVPP